MLAYTLLFIGAVLIYAVIVGHSQAVWKAIFPGAVSGTGAQAPGGIASMPPVGVGNQP